MKRLVVSAMLVLMALPAMSKDMKGRFGLGYDQSMGGVSGFTAYYWLGNFGLKGTLGFDFVIPDSGDSRMGLDFALGGIYNFAWTKDLNIGTGLVIDLSFKNKAAMGTDSAFQFGVEIPLRAEYFFSDHFAINMSTGLVFTMVPKQGTPSAVATATGTPTAPKDKVIGFGTGGLFGTAGFTVYF